MFVNGCVSQPNLFMLDFFFLSLQKKRIKLFNGPPQHIRHPQGPPNTRIERQARRPTDVPKTIFSSLQQFWTGYFFFFVLPYSIYLLPFDHQTMLQWRHSLNKIFHPPRNPPLGPLLTNPSRLFRFAFGSPNRFGQLCSGLMHPGWCCKMCATGNDQK